jgi:hypothetical protein
VATSSWGGVADHSVFLTESKNPGAPHRTSFGCEVDTIYLFVDWPELLGKHTVETVWYNRKNQRQEVLKREFEAGGGRNYVWVALELFRQPNFMGISLTLTPDFFWGQWRVDVYLGKV